MNASAVRITVQQLLEMYENVISLELQKFDISDEMSKLPAGSNLRSFKRKIESLQKQIDDQNLSIKSAEVDNYSVLGLGKGPSKTGIYAAYDQKERHFSTWLRTCRKSIENLKEELSPVARRQVIKLSVMERYYKAMTDNIQTAYRELKPK